MRITLAGVAVVFTLALIAGPAAAESGVATIQDGEEAVVATYTLSQGEVVEYTYSGGFVEFVVERDGVQVYSTPTTVGTGTYTATENGQYVFLFRNNSGNTTIVSYTIKKRFDATPYLIAGGVGAGATAGIGGALWARKRRQAPAAPPQPPSP